MSQEGEPTSLVVSGIKTYIFGSYKKESRQCPLLIFYLHGRQGSARQLFKICRASAEIPNTLVVTFDSRNHGERLVDDQKNGTWMDGNATHALDMYSIMMGNVSDISLLIDLLPSFLGVDVHRFGVAGVSLGGHSVLMALGHEPRISVAVSFIGCGDYFKLMNDRASSMLFCVPSPPSDPFPIAFRNLIHHQDAVKNIARYTKCPLLILSGGKDNLVPSSSNTEFLTRLAEHYSDFPERLQVKEDEDAGHQVTEFMKKEALDFFQNFLNGINPNL